MTKLLLDRVDVHLRAVSKDSRSVKSLDTLVAFLNETALEQFFNEDIDLKDLPSFAPPYEDFFVETRVPFFIIEPDSIKVKSRPDISVGAWFHAYDARIEGCGPLDLDLFPDEEPATPLEPEQVRWTYSIAFFTEDRRHKVYLGAEAVMYLDAAGHVISFRKGEQTSESFLMLINDFIDEVFREQELSDAEEKNAAILHWQDFFSAVLSASLYTIGLLHCRNIGTQEFIPSAGESHKFERKHGTPMHKYHVLKITGKGQGAGTLLGTGTGRQNPLHWVRAHFKTYDDSAPLFGKVAGTFYWGEQVRGSVKAGTVDKDYQVEIKK